MSGGEQVAGAVGSGIVTHWLWMELVRNGLEADMDMVQAGAIATLLVLAWRKGWSLLTQDPPPTT